MEEFFKLIPAGAYQAIGVLVVIVVILFKDLISRMLWKIWNRKNEDGEDRIYERRRALAEPDWFAKFIETTQAHTEATMKSSHEFSETVRDSNDKTNHEIRNLAETIRNLAESVDKRNTKSVNQHLEILEEIGNLKIPRKRERFG